MGVKIYPTTPRVYVDMDGVIADFERGALEHDMLPQYFKKVAGSYLYLHPIEGAKEAIQKIEDAGFHVFGLTKIPDSNPFSATEKLLWIKNHFPQLQGKIIITPDKGAVGTPQDFLIDDHPEWANANNFPGKIIHFKGDWSETLVNLGIN